MGVGRPVLLLQTSFTPLSEHTTLLGFSFLICPVTGLDSLPGEATRGLQSMNPRLLRVGHAGVQTPALRHTGGARP